MPRIASCKFQCTKGDPTPKLTHTVLTMTLDLYNIFSVFGGQGVADEFLFQTLERDELVYNNHISH